MAKVITSKDAWDGFLRRAKKVFPKEHVEAVWGEETVDSYRVLSFKRVKVEKQSKRQIHYSDAEIKRQKWLAQQAGQVFLGTVHTHPCKDYDTSPSQVDHFESAKDGEKVMGVVVLYKKENSNRFVVEVDWWIPQPRIDFVILSC